MRLLVLLIQDYDRRHALPPDASTPAERLRFLLEHSDKSATELPMPIFGQPSHINEALNGKRPISAAKARKLGKVFNVDAGLFLQGAGRDARPKKQGNVPVAMDVPVSPRIPLPSRIIFSSSDAKGGDAVF
jgi:antitoxin component HigA of HigAB toxin-antitoxin module